MPINVLIADDYEDNRELMRLVLDTEGFTVREARDGHECLELARSERPDVALIDLSMPVLDGWNTLQRLRADERTRSVPCVAITAFAAETDRQRALQAGFDAYISKPFKSKDLVDTVRRLLDGHARDGHSRDGHSRDGNSADGHALDGAAAPAGGKYINDGDGRRGDGAA